MAWETGTITDASPGAFLSDRIKNNIGIGSAPLRNWSFVENIPANGTAETQRLTITNFHAGDTFRITFNGHETVDIPYSAVSATMTANLLAALNALVDFNTANTAVTVTLVSGATVFDISSATNTKWWSVAFSLVGSFSITNAVGCSATIVQQVAPVAGTGGVTFDVFKCAGTGNDANDCGTDFYIGIARTTNFYMVMAEEYSTDYKKFRKFGAYNAGHATTGSTVGTDANGYPANHTTNWMRLATIITNSGGTYAFFTLNTTGFTYAIKMTKNFIAVGFRVGVTECCYYLGLMDSFVSADVDADATPLVMFGTSTYLASGSNSYGAVFLRLPGINNLASGTYNQLMGAYPADWTPIFGSNAVNANDKWANNKVIASRILMYQPVTAANYYICGVIRGLVKSDVRIISTGGTINFLDTVDIDGTTYTVMGSLVGVSRIMLVEAN